MTANDSRREIDTAVLVLAHEMSADGTPTTQSRLRLARAVEELENNPDATLVTSGWGYRDDTKATLADAMANAAIVDHGIPGHRIIRLDRSRDTVGDAVFFGLNISARRVVVITSEYHRDRTDHIFRFVLGPRVALKVLGVGPPGNEARQTAEANSLAAFRMTFEGIAPGDLAAIEERLMTAHPFYNGAIDVKALRRHD